MTLRSFRLVLAAALLGGGSSVALAQPADPPPAEGAPAPPPEGSPPEATSPPPGDPPPSTSPPPAAEKKQGKGDFDAGGKVRFPSGPDETGMEFGSFNWVALDLYGRYFITDTITVTGGVPLAPLKPEYQGLMDEAQPSIFGGFTVRPELALGSVLGVGVTLGMLKERAVLLSEKDYPEYVGDLSFATSIGPWVKIKGFGLDFSLQPAFVYQASEDDVKAVQLPIAASLALGSLLKVSLETGVYTGDDFGITAKDGGRISLGAAVDIKISKLIFHLGAGAASLLVSDDPMAETPYKSIGDTIYFDLNVKFAK